MSPDIFETNSVEMGWIRVCCLCGSSNVGCDSGVVDEDGGRDLCVCKHWGDGVKGKGAPAMDGPKDCTEGTECGFVGWEAHECAFLDIACTTFVEAETDTEKGSVFGGLGQGNVCHGLRKEGDVGGGEGNREASEVSRVVGHGNFAEKVLGVGGTSSAVLAASGTRLET